MTGGRIDAAAFDVRSNVQTRNREDKVGARAITCDRRANPAVRCGSPPKATCVTPHPDESDARQRMKPQMQ